MAKFDHPARAPRLLTAEAAMNYLSLSNRDALSAIPVRPFKIGNRTRWDVKALDAWMDGQSQLSDSSAGDRVNEDDPETALKQWRQDNGSAEATRRT